MFLKHSPKTNLSVDWLSWKLRKSLSNDRVVLSRLNVNTDSTHQIFQSFSLNQTGLDFNFKINVTYLYFALFFVVSFLIYDKSS